MYKIKEMAEMQSALDNAIYTAKGVEFDINKCRMALLDEIGELTHELKGEWCWWKDTQAPVNKERVLEELVDCWHFALSIVNHRCSVIHEDETYYYYDIESNNKTYIETVVKLLETNFAYLDYMYDLTTILGFTLDDVYEAYISKNKENYERLKSGY